MFPLPAPSPRKRLRSELTAMSDSSSKPKLCRGVTISNEIRSIARYFAAIRAWFFLSFSRRCDHNFREARRSFSHGRTNIYTGNFKGSFVMWSLLVTSREIAHLSRHITTDRVRSGSGTAEQKPKDLHITTNAQFAQFNDFYRDRLNIGP